MPTPMEPLAVIDFETTGLSPTMGDRATEVAIVMLESGSVVGRFQSLMNAGNEQVAVEAGTPAGIAPDDFTGP